MSAVGRADTTPTVLHTYNLPMTTNAERFDHWIRGTFAELNTQLEERYFAQADRAVVTGVGEELKTQLRAEGNDHVARLLAEGNTDEGFDAGFDLLGNVGLPARGKSYITRRVSQYINFFYGTPIKVFNVGDVRRAEGR